MDRAFEFAIQVNHFNIFQHDGRWIWNSKWIHGWKIWPKGVRQFHYLHNILGLLSKQHLNTYFFFHFSIKRGHHKIQRKPLRSMWTPQLFKHTLIGKSLAPLVVYLIIYICSLIIYEYGFHDSCKKDESKEEKDHDDSKEVSKNCNSFWWNFLKNSIRIPRSSDTCDGLDTKLGSAEFPTKILMEILPEFWLKIHLMDWPLGLATGILIKIITVRAPS